MISYDNYITEGFFRQNLYHFTTIYPFKQILETDILELGYYYNPYNDEQIKTLSLTRNKDLILERETTIRLELDGDLLYQDYKIIPYDFFINDKQEDKVKSDIRIKDVQSEEIILKSIQEISKYLKTIIFYDNKDIYKEDYLIKKLLLKNNDIIIKYKNTIIRYD